jgi:hypothetical protein
LVDADLVYDHCRSDGGQCQENGGDDTYVAFSS